MKPFHHKRFFFIVPLFMLLAALLYWRIVDIHVLQRPFLQAEGKARTLRAEKLVPLRGAIYDRDGAILAMSTQVFDVWIDPQNVFWEQAHWPQVLQALQVNQDDWQKMQTSQGHKRFVYLARQVTPEVAQSLEALNIHGLYFTPTTRRYYPEGEAFATVIGLTNIDQQGQEGIERHFNAWLQGQPGKLFWLQDVRGNKVQTYAGKQPVTPSKSLTLSLEKNIQHMTFAALKAAVLKHRAKAGSAVIVSVKTGEILAMANYPSFNPNGAIPSDLSWLKNRAALDQFEPGSVFKPLAMAAVLASGRYQLSDIVDTSPGYLKMGGNTVRDGYNHGVLTLPEVIQKSSNVGIAKLLEPLPMESFPFLLQQLGIGEVTGVEVPYEAAGSFDPWQLRSHFTLSTLAFGYGAAVTILQLAQAYAILANQGRLIPLTLLQREIVPQPKQVLDAKLAKQIVAMMTAVVAKGGTGYLAAIPNVAVAGKTGTVRKTAPGGGYAEDEYVAIFVGIVPADAPKYVMVIVIDDPRGEKYYGGSVAAPVFSEVMKQVLLLHGES